MYFQVVIGLMGPLFINHLASLKAYGDIKTCNATEGITDINYTKPTYTIQNYTVSTKVGDIYNLALLPVAFCLFVVVLAVLLLF